MTRAVHIAGIAARCAVGFDMEAIHAAVCGRLNGFRNDSRFPSVRTGTPLTLALLPDHAAEHRPAMADRMADHGLQAATECLAFGRHAQGDSAPLRVFLSLPSPRPGWDQAMALKTTARIVGQLPCAADPHRGGVFNTGQHGGLAALEAARKLISEGAAPACLVGGIECFDMAVLDWLDRIGQLKAEDIPCGLIPGEGAAFLLMASPDYMKSRDLPADVALAAAGEAIEPNPWYENRPTQGDGLANAFQMALKADGARADVTYSDHNGQNWRVDEWLVAYLRTAAKHGEPLDLRHPADCWGDLGAATGPMLAALAVYDLRHPWANRAKSALIACSSQMAPHRAAALITRL